LFVIGLIVFCTIVWGSIAGISFPLPPPVIADTLTSLPCDSLTQESLNSAENDYEALETIVGTYRDVRNFSLREDGTLEPIRRLSVGTYVFNQDKIFKILEGESLFAAGNFVVSRAAFGEYVDQISRLNQQELESIINHSEFELYQIDVLSEEGIFADSRLVFFMFRTNSGNAIIHNVNHDDVAVVERLE